MRSRPNAPGRIETAVPDEECDLNLGAESPKSVLHEDVSGDPPSLNLSDISPEREQEEEWKRSGIAVHTDVPARPREWRSQSYSERWEEDQERKKKVKEKMGKDNECGICFDPAFTPRRTPCCRTLYCLEHITDWLTGPAALGLCPSCNTPLTVKDKEVVLNPPRLTIPTTNASTNSASPTTPTNLNRNASPATSTVASGAGSAGNSGTPTNPSGVAAALAAATAEALRNPPSVTTSSNTAEPVTIEGHYEHHSPLRESVVDVDGIKMRGEV